MVTQDFDTLTDDLIELCKSTFGENVRFEPKAGGSFEVRVIFDNRFEQVDPQTEVVVASNQPVVGVKLSDFEELVNRIEKRDVFVIREQTYEVVEVQEDTQGHAKVLLHLVE